MTAHQTDPLATPRFQTDLDLLLARPMADDRELRVTDELIDVATRVRMETPDFMDLIERLSAWVAARADADGHVPAGLRDDVDRAIAGIDTLLSAQLDAVFAADGFRELEGAWRGLADMLERTPLSSDVRVDAICWTRQELGDMAREYGGEGEWRSSPLYKRVYSEAAGIPGGVPYASIVTTGDFGPERRDLDILRFLGRVAEVSFAPVIGNASPACLGLDDWSELSQLENTPKVELEASVFDDFRAIREEEWARFVNLVLPRRITRLPWGPDAPAPGLDYVEGASDLGGAEASGPQYTWSPASFVVATNILRSGAEYGWAARIGGYNSGGRYAFAPAPMEDRGGGRERRSPADLSLSKEMELALNEEGLMVMMHRLGTSDLFINQSVSLHLPQNFVQDAATRDDYLASQLPYLLTASRVGHVLRSLLYDQLQAVGSAETIERSLQDWVNQYVYGGTLIGVPPGTLARQPLEAARVIVTDGERPGHYRLEFRIKPHYLLDRVVGEVVLRDDVQLES